MHDFAWLTISSTNGRTLRFAVAVWLAFVLATPLNAGAQACTGDCDASSTVTVDEVVTLVAIALGTREVGACIAGDSDGDGQVTVDEIISAVARALSGCPSVDLQRVAGVCLRPTLTGLQPCPPGTPITMMRCTDRSGCLVDPSASTVVFNALTGTDGTFEMKIDREAIEDAVLVFEAVVEPTMSYRRINFGPAGAGSTTRRTAGSGLENVIITPVSNATVALLEEAGLDRVSDDDVAALDAAVESANADTDFRGLSVAEAASLAEQKARQDPVVQMILSLPTPTPTVTATPTATPPPDVHIAVEINPNPPAAGEVLQVAVTIGNAGRMSVSDLTIRARLPEQVAAFDRGVVSDGALCNQVGRDSDCNPTEWITWSLAQLAPGGSRTFTFQPDVGAEIAAGTSITVDAEVGTAGGLLAVASDSVTTGEGPRPLEVAISTKSSSVRAGGPAVYDLVFGHVATQTLAPDAVLSIDLPAGTSFVSASDGGSLVDDRVEWTLGTLEPGQSGTRRMVLAVDSDVVDGSMIEAEAILRDGSVPARKTRARTVSRVEAPSPLLLRIEANPDPVAAGEAIRVSVTATNVSPFDLSGVVVTLRMPAELENLGIGYVSGPRSCGSIGLPGTCNQRELIMWNIGSLESGNGMTLTLPPLLAAGLPDGSTIMLEATAGDSLGRYASANRTLLVQSAPSLELSITEDAGPVPAGSQLTYTLTFGHVATQALAPDTTLAVAVPAGTSFVSASDDGTLVGDQVEWPLGTLQPGQSGTRRATFVVDEDSVDGSLVEAEATIRDAGDPANLSRARTLTRVQAPSPLLVTIEANPDPVAAGEPVDVAITATNVGPFDLTGVVVTLRMPAELDNLSVGFVSGPRTCNSVGLDACNERELVVWDIGTLEAGNGITLTLPPVVEAGLPDGATIVFDANVSDSAAHRASAACTILVDTPADLGLVVSSSSGTPDAGGVMSYSLTFGNQAATRIVSDATLRFVSPLGASVLSASEGGAVLEGVVAWDLGDIGARAGDTLSVVMMVDADLMDGSLLVAEGALSGVSSKAITSRGRAVDRVESDSALGLELNVAPDRASPGESVVVSVNVINRGLFDLDETVVTLRMPPAFENIPLGEVSGPAACTVGSNAGCQERELIVWSVGTLEPGEQTTFSLEPRIREEVLPGTAFRLNASASAASGSRTTDSESVLVVRSDP